MPLTAPPPDLSAFPAVTADGHTLFRVHRATLSPWWFGHGGTGRFDLPPTSPNGTCYLALSPLGCFLEVFRAVDPIPESEIQARVVSTLRSPAVRLADCTSGLARAFGITAEIHSSPDYQQTQRWAAALGAAGYDGIQYFLRHDPGQSLVGVALFGPRGSPDWPVVAAEPLSPELIRSAQLRFGLTVARTP